MLGRLLRRLMGGGGRRRTTRGHGSAKGQMAKGAARAAKKRL